MWDRGGTAAAVIIATITVFASLSHHYWLPAKLQGLERDMRRMRSKLADVTQKPAPFVDEERNVLEQIAGINRDAARAAADAILLQSKLLEIIAKLPTRDQAAVPHAIKNALASAQVICAFFAVACPPMCYDVSDVPRACDGLRAGCETLQTGRR